MKNWVITLLLLCMLGSFTACGNTTAVSPAPTGTAAPSAKVSATPAITASPEAASATSARAKPLSVDEALILAQQQLQIAPGDIQYLSSASDTGFYIVQVGKHDKYCIDPVSGDFCNESRSVKLINLLGKKGESSEPESSKLSIEELVVDNIKNVQNFSDENGSNTAGKMVPYFKPGEKPEGGLIINNKFVRLSDLLSEKIGTVKGHFCLIDVNNDKTDELCYRGLGGTGLVPFTYFFQYNQSTGKYERWGAEEQFEVKKRYGRGLYPVFLRR